MSLTTFDKSLATLLDMVKTNIMNKMCLFREDCLAIGIQEPSLVPN